MRGGDDAALEQLERPRERGAGRRGIQAKIVADVVEANHRLDAVDAKVRTEFPEGDVLGAVALVVLVRRGAVQIVQRPAIDRTAEAAFHARAVLIEMLRVEPIGPGRFLVVLGAHRAEQPAWLVEKRRAGHRQGVLHHRGGQQLLRDHAVVRLVWLRGGKLARLRDRDDALQVERAHLRARAAARVDGFRTGHDAAGQHAVLAGAGDVHHRQVARPLAAGVARDRVAQVDVVQARVRRAVFERDHTRRGSSPSSTPPPCRRGRGDRNRSCAGMTGSSRRRWRRAARRIPATTTCSCRARRRARGRSTGPSRKSAGCPDGAATAFRRAAGRGSTCWRRGPRAACGSRQPAYTR